MAAVEETSPAPSRSWASFRAKQTQARPKHSLFGTALEHIDKEELKGISPDEASQLGVRKQPERYPIPEHLQKHLSARALVEKAKGDVKGQAQQVSEARRELQEKELQALAFKASSAGSQHREDGSHGWMTKKDLEHADEINAVGLGKHGSYNRDKYGKKPPTHNYALIGDVMSRGNDFGRRQTYDPDQTLIGLNTQQNAHLDYGSIRLGFNPEVDTDVKAPLKPKSAIDLPPNIRHQFGTRVCDSLLADKKAVDDTIKQQREQWRRAKPPLEVDTKEYQAKSASIYFDVSHMSRCNVFPGHSVPRLESCMKSSHTDAVYLRRELPPDEFRIVKDAYATWAEQNLVREKLKKQWDASAAPSAKQ